MTDTKHRAKRDSDDQDTEQQQAEQTKQGESIPGPTTPSDNAPTGAADNPPEAPAPAQSYAGSGTTEPVELDPATHGTHYRGSTGDV
jgi:hypothetical protein